MCFSEMHMLGLPQSLFPLPSSITQNSSSSEVLPRGWQDTKQLSHASCSHLFLHLLSDSEGVWRGLDQIKPFLRRMHQKSVGSYVS